jgi:hypothetical protein
MQLPKCSAGNGWPALAASCGLLALVWLAVLPQLALHPKMRGRIDRLEKARIDAGAMFYTELECMEQIRHRALDACRRHPRAFWGVPRTATPSGDSSRPTDLQ